MDFEKNRRLFGRFRALAPVVSAFVGMGSATFLFGETVMKQHITGVRNIADERIAVHDVNPAAHEAMRDVEARRAAPFQASANLFGELRAEVVKLRDSDDRAEQDRVAILRELSRVNERLTRIETILREKGLERMSSPWRVAPSHTQDSMTP